ncbi:MAG TPA: RidA family protein [Paracoccus sp. (in: a-proteobacteria)]|uniref:RidA family protein n=1 Tax=Paracoccus sp. TaxID=267 RepID=UPI002CC15699|nr:RidA family protein [Paracoccus sp. (in: a-proteobacteria)]HWL57459.1 RidA family protein [Paracoccus sp. (in: a-proteobacteria)]
MADKKQRFISDKVAEYPPGHWSNTIRVGNQIWLSGFTARAADLKAIHGEGSAYEQTKVIFEKVKNCLESAGSGLQDVVTMTIYVTDMADNKEIWRARQEFFTGDFPCSTLVQVASLADSRIKLEITCQAMAGSGA